MAVALAKEFRTIPIAKSPHKLLQALMFEENQLIFVSYEFTPTSTQTRSDRQTRTQFQIIRFEVKKNGTNRETKF